MIYTYFSNFNSFHLYGETVECCHLVDRPLLPNEILMADLFGHVHRIQTLSHTSNFLDKLIYWIQSHFNTQSHLNAMDHLMTAFEQELEKTEQQGRKSFEQLSKELKALQSLKTSYKTQDVIISKQGLTLEIIEKKLGSFEQQLPKIQDTTAPVTIVNGFKENKLQVYNEYSSEIGMKQVDLRTLPNSSLQELEEIVAQAEKKIPKCLQLIGTFSEDFNKLKEKIQVSLQNLLTKNYKELCLCLRLKVAEMNISIRQIEKAMQKNTNVCFGEPSVSQDLRNRFLELETACTNSINQLNDVVNKKQKEDLTKLNLDSSLDNRLPNLK